MTDNIISQNEFIEYPASKSSISKRKLVFGEGINDAKYTLKPTINDKRLSCPFYKVWHNMLQRCYHKKYHEKSPTYKGCTVAKEWLLFSNFKVWMMTQDYKNKDLDKDIINPNNKIYSPDNCCFISHKLNSLLLDHKARRGKYPQGVTWHNARKKFTARCNVDGKGVHLGLYKSISEALKVYNKFKSDLVIKIAHEQTDIRVKNGLLKHAEIIAN